MQWPWLQDEVDRASQKVETLLRAAPDPSGPVPGMDWSVGQLGSHVVNVAHRMRRMVEGEHIEMPADMATLNDAELARLPTGDLTALADELGPAHEKLRQAWGDDGAREVPFYQFPVSVTQMAGIWLGELLVHGKDLAGALGRPWKIRRDQALAIAEGAFAIAPQYLRQDVAGDLRATIHLALRGGPDYSIEVDHGTCRIAQERPARADLHVSADPVAYLELAYGRRSPWPAALTGRMLAWGRRPRLALVLPNLFRQP